MLSEIQHLKIALMTQGMDVSPAARQALAGADGSRPLTLAEYATTSGISLRMNQDVWVNAPIREHNPNFVSNPPHRLEFENGAFLIRSRSLEVEANPLPVPDYYDKTNRRKERYTSYAVTHTDRVRLSPIEGCAIACQFCDLPYEFRYRRKRIEGLVESAAVALRDPQLPARHVLVSGGTPRPEDYEYENEVYEHVCRAFPAIEVDVMMVPAPGLLDPATLLGAGVHGLSVNLELYNQERARKIMPSKFKLGRKRILEFIARAVDIFGVGRVSSLLVVGLESPEDTLHGVDALAERGCQPVLSPFRPDASTPLGKHAPPSVEDLTRVYERSREIAARRGVALGPRCVPCQHNTLSFAEDTSQ